MTQINEFSQVIDAINVAHTASSDFDLNPEVRLPENRQLRAAAVLLPLLKTPAGLRLILTKRASSLKHHPGQIAFPGGKRDEGDNSLEDAAIREAHEEIGLHPDNVEVLGNLPRHETVTGFIVTPVLARVRATFTPIPESGEVEEVFDVPLAKVTDTTRFSVQYRHWRGVRRHYYTVPVGPYYIWGATARILRTLADGMGQ